MTKSQPNQWLNWICDSPDSVSLRDKYDQWSANYELDVADVWNGVPARAALMLSQHIADKQGVILDAGVGTGLGGVALQKLGFNQLIGFDISPGMLEKAADKGIYQSLICCSIGDPVFSALPAVTGIVATGVFAAAHAGAQELALLRRKLKTKGVLIFTARQSFLPQLQNILTQADWVLIEQQVMPIYEDSMYLFAYRITA